MITVKHIRLYLPDHLLVPRVENEVEPFANYIQLIQDRVAEYWSGKDAEGANGLFIAIGVKPNGSARAWCDAIECSIGRETLRDLEEQLALVPPVSVKHGPIAFAIEVVFDGGTVTEFPGFPTAWMTAAKNAGGSMTIPDELFETIWPDS